MFVLARGCFVVLRSFLQQPIHSINNVLRALADEDDDDGEDGEDGDEQGVGIARVLFPDDDRLCMGHFVAVFKVLEEVLQNGANND